MNKIIIRFLQYPKFQTNWKGSKNTDKQNSLEIVCTLRKLKPNIYGRFSMKK